MEEASNEEISFFDWIDRINDTWSRRNSLYYFFLQKYTELTLFMNRFHQRYIITIIGSLYAIIIFYPLSAYGSDMQSELPSPTCYSSSCRTLIQAGICSGTACACDVQPCNISFAITRNDIVCSKQYWHLTNTLHGFWNYPEDVATLLESYGRFKNCTFANVDGYNQTSYDIPPWSYHDDDHGVLTTAVYPLYNKFDGLSFENQFFYYNSKPLYPEYVADHLWIRDDCKLRYGTLNACIRLLGSNILSSNEMYNYEIIFWCQAALCLDIVFNWFLMSIARLKYCTNYLNAYEMFFWRFTIGPYGISKIIYTVLTIICLSVILNSYQCSIPSSAYTSDCPEAVAMESVKRDVEATVASRVYVLVKDLISVVIMLQRFHFFDYGRISILENEPSLLDRARNNYIRRSKLIENKSIRFDENDCVIVLQSEPASTGNDKDTIPAKRKEVELGFISDKMRSGVVEMGSTAIPRLGAGQPSARVIRGEHSGSSTPRGSPTVHSTGSPPPGRATPRGPGASRGSSARAQPGKKTTPGRAPMSAAERSHSAPTTQETLAVKGSVLRKVSIVQNPITAGIVKDRVREIENRK